MKILAFFGPQRAGKSEAAKAVASLPGWAKLSFADPLYDMVSALLGCDARLLDKSQPAAGLCGQTVRHALQTLGTEWGRGMIGRDIWSEVMRARIATVTESRLHKFVVRDDGYRTTETAVGIVIDDLRFANEHKMLRDLGATIVRIDRQGLDHNTIHSHGSETEWLDFSFDKRFTNYGSVELWKTQMQNFATLFGC